MEWVKRVNDVNLVQSSTGACKFKLKYGTIEKEIGSCTYTPPLTHHNPTYVQVITPQP